MNLTRTARVISAAVVAGVAAVASYSHMRDLASAHGQSALLANLLPVSVDGMLVVASAVMSDDRAAGRPARVSARVSFVVGVAASIVANVLAAPPSVVARVISAWPALALLLVVEMLTGGRQKCPGRHGRNGGHNPAGQQRRPTQRGGPGAGGPAGSAGRNRGGHRRGGRRVRPDSTAAPEPHRPLSVTAVPGRRWH